MISTHAGRSEEPGVVVCAAADATYELGLRVSLFSALEKISEPATLVVLDAGLLDPARLRAGIEQHPRCLSCRVVSARARDTGLDLPPGMSPELQERYGDAIWARLMLDRLLPDVGRVIYLDSDILVRADLASLWHSDLGGATIGAVRDYYMDTFDRGFPWCEPSEGWFAPDLPYFNSGVLLIDLNAWRQHDVGGRVVQHIAEFAEQLRHPDQDALNAVASGLVAELDPRWNVQEAVVHGRDMHFHTQIPIELLVRDSRIVHFTGFKPWQVEALRLSRRSVTLHWAYWHVAARFGGLSRGRLAILLSALLFGQIPRTGRALLKRARVRG